MISFKKRLVGFLGGITFLWGESVILSTVNAQEKVFISAHEIAGRFMEAISIFSVGSYETSAGSPMRFVIEKGALDIVGNVRLKIYFDACLKEKERNFLFKLLNKQLVNKYPNCKLYLHNYQCLHNSSAVKEMCSIRMNKDVSCPSLSGVSEIDVELKCILPLRSSHMFFTESKTYK